MRRKKKCVRAEEEHRESEWECMHVRCNHGNLNIACTKLVYETHIRKHIMNA